MINSTEIHLPVPPSANGLFTNRRGGRAKTDRYEAWIVEAGTELMLQSPHKFLAPVKIDIQVCPPDKRKRDADNLIKPVLDLLKLHAVIQDDSMKFVRGVSIAVADIEPGAIVTVTRAG